MSAYTDEDVQAMAIALHMEDYERWLSGPDPDGTPWGTSREQDRRASYEASARAVLDAVAPAIAARALREAADAYVNVKGGSAKRPIARTFLRDRADEIEAES